MVTNDFLSCRSERKLNRSLVRIASTFVVLRHGRRWWLITSGKWVAVIGLTLGGLLSWSRHEDDADTVAARKLRHVEPRFLSRKAKKRALFTCRDVCGAENLNAPVLWRMQQIDAPWLAAAEVDGKPIRRVELFLGCKRASRTGTLHLDLDRQRHRLPCLAHGIGASHWPTSAEAQCH